MNCLFPVPDSQPTATELIPSPLYGSGTVFRSLSHLLCYFLSSALTWRHTSSNSVTVITVVVPAKCHCHCHVNCSYLLTYLLTYCWQLLQTWTSISKYKRNRFHMYVNKHAASIKITNYTNLLMVYIISYNIMNLTFHYIIKLQPQWRRQRWWQQQLWSATTTRSFCLTGLFSLSYFSLGWAPKLSIKGKI